ncbi:MAG: hypothetical protein QXU01_02690 [Candidatus Hadarchaeales archaeon]
MRAVWCKNLEDLVNIARGFGWLFYFEKNGRHYYYVYVPLNHETICLVTEVKEPLDAKYTTIDDDGSIKLLKVPITPLCVKIVEVMEDKIFEEILKERK